MLQIRASCGPSTIEGQGCIADEFIPAGTIVWKFTPGEDRILTLDEVLALGAEERHHVLVHAYLNCTGFVVCGDAAIYMNHSDTPNLHDLESADGIGENAATVDIHPGAELVVNYFNYDHLPLLGRSELTDAQLTELWAQAQRAPVMRSD